MSWNAFNCPICLKKQLETIGESSECDPAERPVYLTIRQIVLTSDSKGSGQEQTYTLQ